MPKKHKFKTSGSGRKDSPSAFPWIVIAAGVIALAALAVSPRVADSSPGSDRPTWIHAAADPSPASGNDRLVSSPGREALEGYPVTSDVVVRHCGSCHARDSEGRLGRISFLRKTPEGWQASLQRMVVLHGVRIEPETAREVVRYLATAQGLAPEELEPGRFELERRFVEYQHPDGDTQFACGACHTLGRAITQRRTAEEWKLLIATHRTLYPLVDRQRFYNTGANASAPTHPVDRALTHLTSAYPLETSEWRSWSANLRAPRLEGSWALTGHHPGLGAVFGTVEIRPVAGRPDEFQTEARYTYAEDGTTVTRAGQSVVYTGFQWRGRSAAPDGDELREVMAVERGWEEMTGRWFNGAHDEFGLDVSLRRLGGEPLITGVYPRALRSGSGVQEVRIHGANLAVGATPASIDLGPGVQVLEVVDSSTDQIVLRVEIDPAAAVGWRDVFVGGRSRTGALLVYDQVQGLRITPRLGLARIGGIVAPKHHQQFEAIGIHHGPDGVPDTGDDIEIGPVPVQWSIEEFPVTYDDDDVFFVGRIDERGLFTPAADGPNPERSGERNNIGDVWVAAIHHDPRDPTAQRPLTARAHLLVTAPMHMRWVDAEGP